MTLFRTIVRGAPVWTSCLLGLVLSANAAAYGIGIASIAIAPPAPSDADAVFATVSGTRDTSSVTVWKASASRSGTTIRIDFQLVQLGFTVPGSYSATVPLGALPPGTYTVQYFAQTAFGGPPFTDPPVLEASTTFVVNASTTGSAIPTLGVLSLIVLVGATALVGLAVMRRRIP